MFKVFVFTNKKNTKSVALIAELGYTRKFISFDANLIAEILGISVRSLMEHTDGIYDIYTDENFDI